jgi:hypothetical protein
MQKLRSPLALASLLAFAAATAPGQTPFQLGTNTFDDASAISLLSSYPLPGSTQGNFNVSAGRLEYSTPSTSGNYSSVLVMNSGTNTAYTTDWTASLTLSNTTLPSSGYTLMSLQVFDASANSGFFNVGLLRDTTTSSVRVESAIAPGFSVTGIPNTTESQNTDVLFRLSHDATTKDITFGYSLDNGLTYKLTYVFNPSSSALDGAWPTIPTNGYSFRILARNTAGTVDAGTMYADNFSVTSGTTAMAAIPEPSTYAACAGAAALGLAFWHRRRQARRAS